MTYFQKGVASYFSLLALGAVLLFLAGCSSTQYAKVKAQGLYFVSPAYGLLGIGIVEYERAAKDDDK